MRFLLILVLLSVVFCLSEQYTVVNVNGNRDVNEKAHKTPFRNRNTPVVKDAVILRRGASFTVNLDFDSPATTPPTVTVQYLVPDADSEEPQFSENLEGWTVKSTVSGKKGSSTITIPVKASIGRYQLTVKGSRGAAKHLNFVVLLNPLVPQDDVYFAQTDELKEYVFNEEGIIWVGLNKDYEGKLWRFHQFEGANLESSLSLLYNPSIGSAEAAAEPVAIARHISYVTAEHVCRGKWGEGSYTKGCEEGEYCCDAGKNFPKSIAKRICLEPWNVHNTTIILSQYHNSKTSFQYCQCFVFAALMNTIGRSLGLPTRAVTNFNSAADHNGNGAIDQYYEEDAKGYLKHVSGQDSVWNFHVWNECWMKRPGQEGMDLSGWQAFDGTPQVESDGRYQVGPASLNAVYNKKDFRFDTGFVIAEVDAPTSVWVKSKKTGGKYKLKSTTKNNPYDSQGTTGRKISTKRPGLISQACLKRATIADRACEADRVDLTNKYKPQVAPPGLKKRELDENGEEQEGDPDDEDGSEKAGLEVKPVFPKISRNNKVVDGDSITYGYLVKNKAESEAVVHILFEVKATEYTDEEIFHVDRLKKTFTISPNSELDVVRVIKPHQYAKLFHGKREHEDQAYLEFELSINVEDRPAFWFHSNRIFVHAKEEEDRF